VLRTGSSKSIQIDELSATVTLAGTAFGEKRELILSIDLGCPGSVATYSLRFEELAVVNFIYGEAAASSERQARHALIARGETSQIDIPRTHSDSSQLQLPASDEGRTRAVGRFDVRIRDRY
jgi:hypothetical protein